MRHTPSYVLDCGSGVSGWKTVLFKPAAVSSIGAADERLIVATMEKILVIVLSYMIED